MKTELKKAIVNFIFENENVFGLHNHTTHKFRPYIYNADGEYLIGGEENSNFISDAIKLLKN